jgi:hypothetical protein
MIRSIPQSIENSKLSYDFRKLGAPCNNANTKNGGEHFFFLGWMASLARFTPPLQAGISIVSNQIGFERVIIGIITYHYNHSLRKLAY